ncbi:ATP-binding protein [Caulobacter segnis]|uniref:ATP-binding protein n=1 Tax=Caulobacter segnis TaxID=88688 RepID=UPI001CBEB50B|nr:ATP-binding protein [Caulobacter segnis]UAL10159.1 AAA family ATPase [Caulobacter segnis]
MAPVVAMFGLSGVGKGWIASQLSAQRPEVLHLEASALMRAAMRTTGEALRTAPADVVRDNQAKLVATFQIAREAAPDRPVLFDGHSIIDNDQQLVDVPLSAVAGLAPNLVAFVHDDPVALRARRLADARFRPDRSVETLAHQQARAEAVARNYAIELKVPFLRLEAGDWRALNHAFDGLVRLG